MTTDRRRAGRLIAHRDPELAHRAGMWTKAALLEDYRAEAWCARNGLPIHRAGGETVNSAGGFLVPDEIATTIVDAREQFGALRATARVVPMKRDAITIPRRGAGVTAGFIDEGALISDQQTTPDAITLVARKLGALILASSELDEDATVDLGDYLAAEFARALARREDEYGLAGESGVATLLGDAGRATAAAGHDTYAEIDAADLGGLIARLPGSAMPGARWFVSQYGYGATFCRLAASVGGIVAQPDASGRVVPHFMGFPVQVTSVLPNVSTALAGSVMILLGDMSLACTLGDRRVLSLRAARQRWMDSDQVGFLGTERINVVAHDVGDDATPGPIVGLVGGA